MTKVYLNIKAFRKLRRRQKILNKIKLKINNNEIKTI